MARTSARSTKLLKPAALRKPPKQRRQPVSITWQPSSAYPVPLPTDEAARLADLRRYEILDTPAEEGFDHLTQLAALICEAPIALLALVDSDRVWFKSRVGAPMSETSRDVAFCAFAILEPDLFIVPDATADKRFARNPLVLSPPRIRFYAGAPLVSPRHHALGTLCVMDHRPRTLDRKQRETLRLLSRVAVNALEWRREIRALRGALRGNRRREA